MDGFYEWHSVPGQKKKQPWYITSKDRKMFLVVGIWENWKDSISAVTTPRTTRYVERLKNYGAKPIGCLSDFEVHPFAPE